MDKIYGILSFIYGDELYDFLNGNNGMNETDLFYIMFAVLFIISALLSPGFYYKLWDRATWANMWKWFLVLIINAVVVFLENVIWVNSLSDLMVDEDGEKLNIMLTNIICFGFASALMATVVFFVASLFWKPFSINCPHVPF